MRCQVAGSEDNREGGGGGRGGGRGGGGGGVGVVLPLCSGQRPRLSLTWES